ncbi:unnamed protein product [Dibothriocephalus latus]|uniref:alpha-1,2-Mannosidase n=1 Tax=Dibothriocephalus latus TaxID=60516 RepID=A0A3P7P0Z3_DIBLA|nr:unnamed protein product [Dibothriocephalus latus]
MSKDEIIELKNKTKEMFFHAYRSYMKNAFPADELMPLSCKGRYRNSEPSRGDIDDALGNFSLTLIDSLDTFGLLGGHVAALELKASHPNRMTWYDKQLLEMAVDAGNRLLPAFNTSTGLPYPRVNLNIGRGNPRRTEVSQISSIFHQNVYFYYLTSLIDPNMPPFSTAEVSTHLLSNVYFYLFNTHFTFFWQKSTSSPFNIRGYTVFEFFLFSGLPFFPNAPFVGGDIPDLRFTDFVEVFVVRRSPLNLMTPCHISLQKRPRGPTCSAA